MSEILYQPAEKKHAEAIAKLIMLAMSYECCQFFAGENHTLNEFEQMMTELVRAEKSQYSFRNTIVALADEEVVGICVSYNGGDLHELRKAFVEAAQKWFGRDFSQMDDETSAGELYLDSLAVSPNFQKRGIASNLIKEAAKKAREMGFPALGLLVDESNPDAEKLYIRNGFQYKNANNWGGHTMRHYQLDPETI